MLWEDVREAYPSQWVIIEALEARTKGNKRIVGRLTIVDKFDDNSDKALQKYIQLHKIFPEKELYVVHTSRPILDIEERRWVGVRAI